MDIISTLDRRDYFRIVIVLLPKLRLPIKIMCGLMIAGVPIIILMYFAGWVELWITLVVAVGIVFSLTLQWYALKMTSKAFADNAPKLIRVTEEGLETENKKGKALLYWSNFKKFEKRDSIYYLYFSKNPSVYIKENDVPDKMAFEHLLTQKIAT